MSSVARMWELVCIILSGPLELTVGLAVGLGWEPVLAMLLIL